MLNVVKPNPSANKGVNKGAINMPPITIDALFNVKPNVVISAAIDKSKK